MKLAYTRADWQIAVAWMALHQMNWEQLRATVVYEPARRVWAWEAMLKRSERVKNLTRPELRALGRGRGFS